MYRVQRLKNEIGRLREEQIAAQASGMINGMTVEESRRYKERHLQIKKLAKQLAEIDVVLERGRFRSHDEDA